MIFCLKSKRKCLAIIFYHMTSDKKFEQFLILNSKGLGDLRGKFELLNFEFRKIMKY